MWVLHQPLAGGMQASLRPGRGWHVLTCQRELWVSLEPYEGATVAETHQDAAGYQLLLEVATGLRSAVAGETNIAGQLRTAWKTCADTASPTAQALTPVIRALFEDTARIRTQYLQGLGGNSYGTLTRLLLKPQKGDRVLLVGNGCLANSVAPVFVAFPDFVQANREAATAALPGADVVVFCTPPATEFDAQWLQLLHARHLRREKPLKVAHLGCRRDALGAWAALPGLQSLDELFTLQESQRQLRARQIERARQACRELALARWEVLATGAPLKLRA